MDEKQFQNFKKVITHASRQSMEKFIADEIEAQPDKKDFFSQLLDSEFFTQLYERGFLEGISWNKKHYKTTFVL